MRSPGCGVVLLSSSASAILISVATAGVTSSTFAYNSAGLLTTETVTLQGVSGTFTTTYGYDVAGRLTSIGYPSGRVVSRTYDSGVRPPSTAC